MSWFIDTFNPFRLRGKTVLVTGASSGIGRETAVICSKMGATVIISARNAEMLADTLNRLDGMGHKIIVADLSDESQIDNLAIETPELDGIVHCAGIGDRTMLKMARKKDIERVMKANFDGPVLLQRALLKRKRSNRRLLSFSLLLEHHSHRHPAMACMRHRKVRLLPMQKSLVSNSPISLFASTVSVRLWYGQNWCNVMQN